MEHRAGIEPAYTGFADLRVYHFATGALRAPLFNPTSIPHSSFSKNRKPTCVAAGGLLEFRFLLCRS